MTNVYLAFFLLILTSDLLIILNSSNYEKNSVISADNISNVSGRSEWM